MRNKTNLVLGIIIALAAIVGVFVLFAPGFGSVDDYGSTRGSGFEILFGAQRRGYVAVGGLIVAFVCLCLGVFSAFVSAFLPGKAAMIGFGATALLLAAAGILFIFAPAMFKLANPAASESAEAITLGAGFITAMIFSFIGALLSFYGAYETRKA